MSNQRQLTYFFDNIYSRLTHLSEFSFSASPSRSPDFLFHLILQHFKFADSLGYLSALQLPVMFLPSLPLLAVLPLRIRQPMDLSSFSL